MPGKDFGVEDSLATETASGLGDFWESCGDAFEVPRKDMGAGAVGVDLGTNAIEFWLHPERPLPKPGDDRRGVRLRDREHAFDGLENP